MTPIRPMDTKYSEEIHTDAALRYTVYITGVGASSNDEKTLASTITYTASAADNGGNLSCEAMNSVSDSLRADTIRLNILCMFAISLWNMD